MVTGYAHGALGDIMKTAQQTYGYYRYGTLHDAIRQGDIEKVKALIELKVNVNGLDERGSTPLQHAPNAEITRALIKAGADVNQEGRDILTPLHFAAQRGDVDSVRALIKAGANVKADANGSGWTPLHEAKNAQVAEELIKAGADVNLNDRNGSPLYRAAGNNRLDVVKMLLKYGANPKDMSGSMLNWAASDEIKELLRNAAQGEIAFPAWVRR